MRSLHSRSFLAAWRMLYNQSNPGLKHDCWTCEDIDWVRESHTFVGRGYAFRIESHTLTLLKKGRVLWSLLVVIEHWWMPGKTADLKSSEWCRPLAGTSKQILAWFGTRS